MQTTKTSVVGAINMLGIAKRVKARILQASTSEIYGDPTVHPQTEDYRGNVSTFVLLRAMMNASGAQRRCSLITIVNIKVARIFNTFGPRMQPNDGRVISNFIVQALQNNPITIFGDGSQIRLSAMSMTWSKE